MYLCMMYIHYMKSILDKNLYIRPHKMFHMNLSNLYSLSMYRYRMNNHHYMNLHNFLNKN